MRKLLLPLCLSLLSSLAYAVDQTTTQTQTIVDTGGSLTTVDTTTKTPNTGGPIINKPGQAGQPGSAALGTELPQKPATTAPDGQMRTPPNAPNATTPPPPGNIMPPNQGQMQPNQGQMQPIQPNPSMPPQQ